MISVAITKRAACLALLGAVLAVGCGRWQPPKNYEVPTQAEPQASFASVLEAVNAKNYTIVTKDEAAQQLRVQAQANNESFIDIAVLPGEIKLTGAGALVRDGKVHRALANEMDKLASDLQERLGPAPATADSATPPQPGANAANVSNSAGAPEAWREPAYDPSVWGNGNFTCLPVRVPAEHQNALTLQLSNGEKADLQLSLAYAPELCRSPTQCKQPGGCPALGIGDTERVNRLAMRLSKGQIGAKATLLDGGTPVATIDLTQHGSVVQALSELKR